MRPQFFLLAGPNGAGKSINGRDFIPPGVPIFDGDLVFKELTLKYPHIEPERLGGGVTVALENARDKAIAEHANFAFESNFSNNMATDITLLFRDSGYKTSLIFFGLDNVARSSLRVQDRVKLGGHYIPYQNLKFNFEEGIKRVNEHMGVFDTVQFVDTTSNFPLLVAHFNKESGVHGIINKNVLWFNENFHDTFTGVCNSRSSDLEPPQPDINTGPSR